MFLQNLAGVTIIKNVLLCVAFWEKIGPDMPRV